MPTLLDRRYWMILILVWLIASLFLVAINAEAIANWRFRDPDDQLRVVQVRDWLAGQSWWDITQYRMNPPDGGPMHWSRLVDVPIAGLTLLFALFVERALAEHMALAALPLLTLLIVFWLYASAGRRLFGAAAPLLACALLVTILPVISQLVPMRIDHHGWQLVCFMSAFAALFDRQSPHRAGIIMGLALALWMEISIEGLPFAALFIGLLGLRWIGLWSKDVDERAGVAFATATIALAAGSALLYSVTESWAEPQYCDSLSPFHVIAFAAIALVIAAGVHGPQLAGIRLSWQVRVAICVAAAGAGLAVMLLIAPQCSGDAFGALDPLVREYWYDRTLEGLPLWALDREYALPYWAGLGAGAIALIWFCLSSHRLADGDKTMLMLLFLGTALVGLFVSRTALYALCIANMLQAAFFVAQMKRAETLSGFAPRMGLRVLAVVMIMPGVFVQTAMGLAAPAAPAVPVATAASQAPFETQVRKCQAASAARALRALPPKSTIMAGLDTSPAILLFTDHRVVATGHHRNQAAMADVIRAFIGSEADARRIYKARGIDYLVSCEGSFELRHYYTNAPDGFFAQLRAGTIPNWLVRENAIGPFAVYRVDWSKEAAQ
jgi:hypothetical protein